jgi:hypothetical protein
MSIMVHKPKVVVRLAGGLGNQLHYLSELEAPWFWIPGRVLFWT